MCVCVCVYVACVCACACVWHVCMCIMCVCVCHVCVWVMCVCVYLACVFVMCVCVICMCYVCVCGGEIHVCVWHVCVKDQSRKLWYLVNQNNTETSCGTGKPSAYYYWWCMCHCCQIAHVCTRLNYPASVICWKIMSQEGLSLAFSAHFSFKLQECIFSHSSTVY